jgi:hypothetical protein
MTTPAPGESKRRSHTGGNIIDQPSQWQEQRVNITRAYDNERDCRCWKSLREARESQHKQPAGIVPWMICLNIVSNPVKVGAVAEALAQAKLPMIAKCPLHVGPRITTA